MEHDFASSPVPAEIALWTGYAFGAVGVGCTLLLVVLRRRAGSISKKRTTIAGSLEPLLFQATENTSTSPEVGHRVQAAESTLYP
ncbi:MAG TPA: hypothetical protein DEP46_14135, partial [Blastocatellia bacterium]|nr:hypothetical protein [Blastocatellia bacterium]